MLSRKYKIQIEHKSLLIFHAFGYQKITNNEELQARCWACYNLVNMRDIKICSNKNIQLKHICANHVALTIAHIFFKAQLVFVFLQHNKYVTWNLGNV